MSTKLHLAVLGDVTPDKHVPEWLVSDDIAVAFFAGAPLQFVLTGYAADPAPDEFVAAVTNFLSLTLDDRALATPYVFRYYRRVAEIVGDDDVRVRIVAPSDVWSYVTPTQVYVSRRHHADQKVYVQVTAECEWEPEHGLQLVYREGKVLTRVSDQDGHLTHTDAYDLPETEDRIC